MQRPIMMQPLRLSQKSRASAQRGATKEEFLAQTDKMASDALESGSPQNTMRVPTKEEIIAIYNELF